MSVNISSEAVKLEWKTYISSGDIWGECVENVITQY